MPTGVASNFPGVPLFDPITPDTLYVGASKSTDGGGTWNAMKGFSSLPAWFAVDPITPGTLYAVTDNAIVKSTDGGATSAATALALYGGDVYALAIDPGTPSTLYAGTGGGVFKRMERNLGPLLAIDPITPRTLYAGTAGGRVFKSTDGAANWYWHVADGLPSRLHRRPRHRSDHTQHTLRGNGGRRLQEHRRCRQLARCRRLAERLERRRARHRSAHASTLYVGTSQICRPGACGGVSGVFRSTDGGVTWKATGLTSRVDALAIDPLTPSTLYAGTSYVGSIFKSTDRGDTWKPTVNEELPGAPALVIDPVTPSTLYVGTGSGVFKSTDAGASWNALNTGLANLSVTALVIDPIAPSTLYAGTTGGVYAIEQVTPCVGDCHTQTPTRTLTPTATLVVPPTCVDNCTRTTTPTPTPNATPPSPSPTALRALLTKITTGDIVTTPAWYWNGAWGDYDDDG